ncbi:MAG: chemotaxis protein CheW [Caldicoprobacterales bacterium]|jgi:purine-binding chemotaxis protein CheW
MYKEETTQFVVFRLGLEEYAIPILKINEIIRLKGISIAEVPDTHEYVLGIINLRGEVIPLMDLRLRFGMPKKDLDSNHRVIIVNIQDKNIGLLVDSVSEVAEIHHEDIVQPPEEISNINTQYITGVAKHKERIFVILDIDNIISPETI